MYCKVLDQQLELLMGILKKHIQRDVFSAMCSFID